MNSFQKEFIYNGKERIAKVKEQYKGYEIVSLHLRRGDNTDGSNPNSQLTYMYGGNKLKENSFYGVYLHKSKKIFEGKKVKFLLFTGGARAYGNNNMSDSEWCRNNLIGEEFIQPEETTDTMLDYASIMCCDHNILSPVSSFGWWAAYTNQNKEAKVVAPKHYHPDIPTLTFRENFYPEKWIIT